MRRFEVNSLAEQFSNRMIHETMNGYRRTGSEWYAEFRKQYPDLPQKEAMKVVRKVVRYIKAAGNPNDANM
jgi:hypothetical protein